MWHFVIWPKVAEIRRYLVVIPKRRRMQLKFGTSAPDRSVLLIALFLHSIASKTSPAPAQEKPPPVQAVIHPELWRVSSPQWGIVQCTARRLQRSLSNFDRDHRKGFDDHTHELLRTPRQQRKEVMLAPATC